VELGTGTENNTRIWLHQVTTLHCNLGNAKSVAAWLWAPRLSWEVWSVHSSQSVRNGQITRARGSLTLQAQVGSANLADVW